MAIDHTILTESLTPLFTELAIEPYMCQIRVGAHWRPMNDRNIYHAFQRSPEEASVKVTLGRRCAVVDIGPAGLKSWRTY
jgi:hypothetical protein